MSPAPCSADFVKLGAAADYAVLGIGGTVTVESDFEVYQSGTVVNGNVGVGPYTTFTHGMDATINGRLDYHSTAPDSGNVTLPSITGTITGGTHAMDMRPIIANALAADTFFAGLTPTQTFSTLSENQVITATVSGLNVIRITGDVTLKQGLTISGAAGDQFVFQLTAADAASAKTLTLSGMTMTLTGGVTGDNILWDLTGGGGQIAITSMADDQIVYGTFLAPYRSFTVDHGIIDGRVIGGGSPNPVGLGDNVVSIHSGSQITQPDTPTPPEVPEPSTIALAMSGLVGLGLAGLRRRWRRLAA